jgi:polyisoprenoid-binding protein YceI
MRKRLFGDAITAALAAALFSQPVWAGETTLTVDANAGNNTFNAVFDAALGERITAVSSAIGCTIVADENTLTGRAKCSVPLTSIKVDSDDIKTEHFQQWATNKKSDPQKCTFELEAPNVTLPSALQEKQPVSFSTEGTFTICGRTREGGQPEKIQGTIVLLPAGSLGDGKAYRIRAKVEGFNREHYGVSPRATAGWLARVQQLANVVATDGTIDVNIFATEPDGDSMKSAMMKEQ